MKSKNVVFMTAMIDAPDRLDYAEWCYKSWQYWCDKNGVELFILEDESVINRGNIGVIRMV